MKSITSTIILLFSITQLFAQSDKEMVESTVNKNTIEGHIYFLADDLLLGRQTGSPENKIAASYLANTLRGYGVKPVAGLNGYYQNVPLKKTSAPKRVYVNLNGEDVKQLVAMDIAEINYGGSGVYLGYGLQEDYKNKDVAGKVIIIKGGSSKTKDTRAAFGLREEKAKLAKANGAVGIVELVDTDESIWSFIDHNYNSDKVELAIQNTNAEKNVSLPYTWVRDSGSKIAANLGKSTRLKMEFNIIPSKDQIIQSQNVVGYLEGSDSKLKDEFIIYSGHYDHVGVGQPDATGDTIYNGARDNAVGVTTVLSVAENLAKYPTKRSALFILFTGEEKGLLGSQYYVENPALPLKQMVYCFNSDNAGYNDTSVATIVGLGRTTAEKNIKNAATEFGLQAIDDPAPEQGLFDRSDNVHFAKAGIPAPTFSLGFKSFDGDVTKYYHQANDEAETLDYNYLYKFFKSYVLASRLIGNDPNTPKWVKGDKYEADGIKLYGGK